MKRSDPSLRRRDFLRLGLAVPALALGGCKLKLSMEQGMFNQCLAPKGQSVLQHPLVTGAWQGLDPAKVWDTHAHLFGNGRSNQGLWMNPRYDDPTALTWRVRKTMFVNGGCAGSDEARMDEAAVERIRALMAEMPPGAKLLLLAFDYTYDEAGRRREDQSSFAVSHPYAMRVARSNPERFEWAASIHPYRDDAVAALAEAKANGARAVKWLPPAMGIDLGHARTRTFYEALKRLDVPLIVHLGEEQAVPGAERHEFANPLHIRHALESGVRVVVAHCASLGHSPDLDANPDPAKAPEIPNFELFRRLMRERRYEGQLFGDISAVTQANRGGVVAEIIAERAWDARLLNGSDYPLPGIMPLFSLNAYVSSGLLREDEAVVLRELRNVHPLQFDFVLKRCLRYRGERLPDRAFETRVFFERPHGPA